MTMPACEEGEGEWVDLEMKPEELRPQFTLTMGQCFNWRQKEGSEDEWVGVVGSTVLAVKQTPDTTLIKCLAGSPPPSSTTTSALRDLAWDYFQLKSGLGDLYHTWSKADPRMQQVAHNLPGVRVCRQDPTECLFSFICSSNNNIPRITLMLDRLRRQYGQPLMEGWYAFPTVDRLAQASESELRALGLGYRARYIRETAMKIMAKGPGWLEGLRSKPRAEAQASLMELSGVGRKVADCVALFSLDQTGAIPVDVHVWRIACRDYDPSLKNSKSLTPAIYERVGDLFRDRFGDCAGWAHSLLFAAELPNYRVRLPASLQEEMDSFRQEEKVEKLQKREDKKRRQQEQELEEGEEEGGKDLGTPEREGASATPRRRSRAKASVEETPTTVKAKMETPTTTTTTTTGMAARGDDSQLSPLSTVQKKRRVKGEQSSSSWRRAQ